jgi:hypothetical protein
MFTQVLGIMTSLLITSQSKERPFVPLHSQAILVSQQPLTIMQERSYHRAKTFLMEDTILPELLPDNLSNVREGIFTDSDASVRERKTVRPKQSYSESQTSCEKSDNSNNTSNVGGGNYVGKGRKNAQFMTFY